MCVYTYGHRLHIYIYIYIRRIGIDHTPSAYCAQNLHPASKARQLYVPVSNVCHTDGTFVFRGLHDAARIVDTLISHGQSHQQLLFPNETYKARKAEAVMPARRSRKEQSTWKVPGQIPSLLCPFQAGFLSTHLLQIDAHDAPAHDIIA